VVHATPRQSINIDFDVLELCADLFIRRQQKADYWKSVPIPLDPNRATPYEGLLRTAVFVPLALVLVAWTYLGIKMALATFLALALPLMVVLHNTVRRAVRTHLSAAAEVDQGRYAAVLYLSEKLGLSPEEITLEFVNEQAVVYAKLWLKVNADHKAERAARAATAAAAAKVPISRAGHGTGSGTGRFTAGVASAAAGAAVGTVMEFPAIDISAPSTPQFNPANGLPMMDDVFDVHGNTTGTTNVDDMTYLDEMPHGASQSFDDFAAPVFDMGSFGDGHGYGFD